MAVALLVVSVLIVMLIVAFSAGDDDCVQQSPGYDNYECVEYESDLTAP